jgi:hypothetical protein
MKKILIIVTVFLLAVAAFILIPKSSVPEIGNFRQVNLLPKIFPDYAGITVPPNLAPINFMVKEPGEQFLIRISAPKGKEIKIFQKNPEIRIPSESWKQLLIDNLNDSICLDIYALQNGHWMRFKSIKNRISGDKIDPYLYYRDIVPSNSYWNQMSMHQRDLESFKETEIINNYSTDHNCVNCHTFNQNNPDQMLFHIRGNHSGTVFYNKGKLTKINLKTPQTISVGAYCSWHPSGKIVAFAVNKIKQNYYLSGYEHKMKEVFDLASDIVLYNIEKNTVYSFPQISSPERENLPCWSPDGKYLYYTQAKKYVVDMPNEENLYSLMRASYNIENNTMGQPEVLISGEGIKKSIAFPTISPDGRYLLFCMVDFGYFPINNKTSDLYLMDLQTGKYYKPEINSKESESYISWSNNSRWFVFSSRRLDGMTSKPYLCHIDAQGNLSKPFILPQEDPLFYTIDHRNFARPELMKGRFRLTFSDLKEVIFSEATYAKYESTTGVDPVVPTN